MAANTSRGVPLTIYLAEDQVAIRETLIAYLTTNPQIKVVGQAGEGHQTIEECMRIQPKLLLLDVDLPGLNGISVCRALTSAAIGVRILIFTSHCDAETVRQVLEAGALGVMEKTGRLETLMRAIASVGAGRAFFGERVTQIVQQSLCNSRSVQNDDNLTLREREVLQLIAEGASNKEIAPRLGISTKTVENHRSRLMVKLGAHNSADLTREAFRLGVVRTQQFNEHPGYS